MTSKPIVAVMGATGAQGGSLIRAMQADDGCPFAIRAITRNPDSEKAKALAIQGIEVVFADADDEASLTNAFQGAYGVFALTSFWDHFTGDREKQQAINIAKASKNAAIEHVVWSTLEDTRKWLPITDERMPVLQEKYNVPHFDAKGEADATFRELGVPTTFLITSFYWENFIFFGQGPQRMPDGSLALVMCMGDAKLPGIGVEDIGKTAYALLLDKNQYVGKTIGIAGGHLTGHEMAAALSKATGKTINYIAVSADAYRDFGYPGAEEMGNMYQFKRDFNDIYCGNRDLSQARMINPDLQSFEEWLERKAQMIPIPE